MDHAADLGAPPPTPPEPVSAAGPSAFASTWGDAPAQAASPGGPIPTPVQGHRAVSRRSRRHRSKLRKAVDRVRELPPPRLAAVAAAALLAVAAVVALATRGSPQDATAAPPGKAAAGALGAAPELVLGLSAAFSGSDVELARGMKTGLELAFATANEEGGVAGRKVRLVALDDRNDPELARPTLRELVEGHGAFAVIAPPGSAAAAAAAPFAAERKVLLFGGDSVRRDASGSSVFQFRASPAEEAAAAVRYLTMVRRFQPEELAFFGQEDGFGEAGWAGLAAELERQGKSPADVLRTGYARNSLDVSRAVSRVRARGRGLKAVVMMATHGPAVRFITALKESRARLVYTNASAVEGVALAEALHEAKVRLADDIVVTQVVPLPTSQASAVIRYRQLLAARAHGEPPTSASLEGYLTGRLLVEGLKRAGPNLDTASVVAALEGLRDVDLGVGVKLAFAPNEHQASHKVWGTLLQRNGTYRAIDLE